MNMWGLMDRLTYINLLMLYFFVSIHGRREGVFPRCEVTVKVRRGTTVKKIPQQSVTVSCPVIHCGKSVNVIWCKLSNTSGCQQMGNTENVEIWQNSSLKDELISYLTFKEISVYDDGLYRCELRGYGNGDSHISHHITISVSDTHQGVESDGSIAAASLSHAVDAVDAVDESASWYPYFYICGGIALLVFTLTALTLRQFYGCKQVPTDKPTRNQKIYTHMIPDLPKWFAPSSPGSHAQYVLNDIYSRTPPPRITANEHQEYAVINHAQSGISANSKQQVVTEQDKDAQYAAIVVS